MTPAWPWLLALILLPLVLACFRERTSVMRAVALSGWSLPFLLPESEPMLRGIAAIFTWLFLAKTLQFTAGHETPRGFLDVFQFLVIPAVVRWETPRQRDLARSGRTLMTALLQIGLTMGLVRFATQLDARSTVQLFTTQLSVYLVLAGCVNLLAVSLALRGLDYDDPFDFPFLARTPAEFWGRRWNTWVNHMLHRYVFAPANGRRHPVRGTFAAFTVSAALHEGAVVVGTQRFSGWMAAFFLIQGVLVVITSKSRWFRRLAKRAPLLTWALTLASMLTTGVMLVRGADGVDPTNAWRRCCGPSNSIETPSGPM